MAGACAPARSRKTSSPPCPPTTGPSCFLPRWRMDDVMISFAATGGSVGAHVDQYDVFLLQAHGHRRWQIDASESIKGKQPPLGFRPDVELSC
ncbi:hypothetical protein G6F31_017957 [Rhizopus arrhizus]|nr:hypothetical protein G6F31_017957 [Rhizopus arrhizus]